MIDVHLLLAFLGKDKGATSSVMSAGMSGINNAQMTTPAEGSSPRMEMFKFTGIVMKFAPLGIGAAMAVTVGHGGDGESDGSSMRANWP